MVERFSFASISGPVRPFGCPSFRDVVETLDLTTIEAYAEERGSPPYHPRMMVAMLLSSTTRCRCREPEG